MTAYNLTIIRPRGFLHSSAFLEVRDSLAWALTQLGHTANCTENWIDKNDTNIIFGCELLAPNQPQALPPKTIVFNLEQSTHPNMDRVRGIVRGSRVTVWDYNLRNVENWKAEGANVHHVPVGYTPTLTRIPQAKEKDIDILFLGWLTPRRKEVIQSLKDAGFNVVASDKCYGGGRDNLISRAKICLNVHHNGRTLFEIVRMSYYLANSKCVVSELSDDDAEYRDLHFIACRYDDIVATCKRVIDASAGLEIFGANALRSIQQRDFVGTVNAALTNFTPQEKVQNRYLAGTLFGDMKDYMPYLKEKARGTVLEIGVRDGASTSALLCGVESKGGLVLSVDIADCGTLFAGHPQWKFIQSDSQNPKLHVPSLDVIFIDGDHTREGYRADLERFFPLVNNGGLIISHDISPDPAFTLEKFPGSDYPSEAIGHEYFRFAAEHGLKHEELPGVPGLGILTK